MKAFQGVNMSYDLQSVIQKNDEGYYCGYRDGDNKISLLNHVYGMIRSNKQYRRPYIIAILKQFDDKKCTSSLLYYLTENLAYTKYNTQEEPLFVIHHIDTMASVSGANILQSFKELINTRKKTIGCGGKSPTLSSNSDDDDDNEEKLTEVDCIDEEKLRSIVNQSFGCLLLLDSKAYLKILYGFSDTKCQKYSLSEPSKLYDKAIIRRNNQEFISNYKHTIFSKTLTKQQLMEYFFEFKQMMMSLDTEDESDNEDIVKTEMKTEEHKDNEQEDRNEELHHQLLPITEPTTHPDVESVERTAGGIVPQTNESTSLPGLSINIPIIPLKMLEPSKQKNSRKSRTSSRRSSRSSRCSSYQEAEDLKISRTPSI